MSSVRVFTCFHADFACVVVVATRSSRLCFVVSILPCCAFFLFYFEFAVRACCSYAVHIFLFVSVRLSCVSHVFFFAVLIVIILFGVPMIMICACVPLFFLLVLSM